MHFYFKSVCLADTNDVFVIDAQHTIYVWIGDSASTTERDSAYHYAEKYLDEHKKHQPEAKEPRADPPLSSRLSTGEGEKTFSSRGIGDRKSSGDLDQSENDDDLLRRYSQFIGNREGSDNVKKEQSTHCKLCIKPFSLLRRRIQCRWCEDIICSDCSQQKAKLPNSKDKSQKRVCDACFGVLRGMIGDDMEIEMIDFAAEGGPAAAARGGAGAPPLPTPEPPAGNVSSAVKGEGRDSGREASKEQPVAKDQGKEKEAEKGGKDNRKK